jgi:hypothetical protein
MHAWVERAAISKRAPMVFAAQDLETGLATPIGTSRRLRSGRRADAATVQGFFHSAVDHVAARGG